MAIQSLFRATGRDDDRPSTSTRTVRGFRCEGLRDAVKMLQN